VSAPTVGAELTPEEVKARVNEAVDDVADWADLDIRAGGPVDDLLNLVTSVIVSRLTDRPDDTVTQIVTACYADATADSAAGAIDVVYSWLDELRDR
jgi:hypothetical protein